MKNTTLCYITRGDKVLLLHRVKKLNDLNGGKWVGVGGKFEPGETADECLLREVKEETGLTLTKYDFRGIVTFVSDKWESEDMYLYTADEFCGELTDSCDEGVLKWVKWADVPKLPQWEGDKVFFDLIAENAPFFRLRLEYAGDDLIKKEFLK